MQTHAQATQDTLIAQLNVQIEELRIKGLELATKEAQLNAKDEQLQRKDAQLEAKDAQLAQMYESCRLQYELRAMHRVLGRRNLRDALERVADAIPGGSQEDGVQPRLTKMLQKDKAFLAVLRAEAQRAEVPLDRAVECMKTIYRSACQNIAPHDEEAAEVHLSAKDPVQRAVVRAIFEHGGIPYRIIE